MHPNDKPRFEIHAINANGFEITMSVVERNNDLFLYNGLDRYHLPLNDAWTWDSLEAEIRKRSGVGRMVLIPH